MKIENHLENLKESIREIEEAITKGLEEKQRTLAFHASSAAADMLEIILHKNNLVDMGFIFKHEWLNSKNIIKEKISFDFPKKIEIIDLMMKIEAVRNPLCYGRRREAEELILLVEDFNKLRKLFEEVSGYGL